MSLSLSWGVPEGFYQVVFRQCIEYWSCWIWALSVGKQQLSPLVAHTVSVYVWLGSGDAVGPLLYCFSLIFCPSHSHSSSNRKLRLFYRVCWKAFLARRCRVPSSACWLASRSPSWAAPGQCWCLSVCSSTSAGRCRHICTCAYLETSRKLPAHCLPVTVFFLWPRYNNNSSLHSRSLIIALCQCD